MFKNFIIIVLGIMCVTMVKPVKKASANNSKFITIETSQGNVVIETLPKIAPNHVKRKLSLLWGAYPYLSKVQGYEAAIQEAKEIIIKENLAEKGNSIVVVAGMPFGISGSTNSIRVVEI